MLLQKIVVGLPRGGVAGSSAYCQRSQGIGSGEKVEGPTSVSEEVSKLCDLGRVIRYSVQRHGLGVYCHNMKKRTKVHFVID